MEREKKITIAISIVGLLLTVAGWFAIPIIRAKVEGEPLNGLNGVAGFWKIQTTRPIPLWLGVLAVVTIGLGTYLVVTKKKQRSADKIDLRIVILSTPPPRWYIGAMGKTPILSLMVHV